MAKTDVRAIREYMDEWVRRSIELRPLVVPGPTAPPQDVQAALIQARGRLDVLEELISQAISLRGSTRRAEAACKDKVSDAWDAEYERRKHAGTFRNDDYKSGREKEAEINLAIREVRLEYREMRDLLESLNEVTDRLWLKFNGMRAVREELLQRMRSWVRESDTDR